MDDIQTFTLPAGTVVYRNGIPMHLVADTLISANVNNWPFIKRSPFVRAGEFGQPFRFEWADSSTRDNNSGKQD